MRERAAREPVEWSVAKRCRRGEATSGDLAVVNVLPDGALVAGVDGLGHGAEAARAAGRAGDVVRASPGPDLVRLMQRCHIALRGTRGAAISLAFISASEGGMTWLGVGNVEGRVVSYNRSATRPKGSLALGRGVAGYELPAVRTAALEIRPGDVLILATDGVTEHGEGTYVAEELPRVLAEARDLSAAEIGDRILTSLPAWAAPTDDVTAVVVKRV